MPCRVRRPSAGLQGARLGGGGMSREWGWAGGGGGPPGPLSLPASPTTRSGALSAASARPGRQASVMQALLSLTRLWMADPLWHLSVRFGGNLSDLSTGPLDYCCCAP